MNIDFNKDEKVLNVDIKIKDVIIAIALVFLGFIAVDVSKISNQNKTLIELNSEILVELQNQSTQVENDDTASSCETE